MAITVLKLKGNVLQIYARLFFTRVLLPGLHDISQYKEHEKQHENLGFADK